MSINFTTKSIFVILILAGFILTGCYDEPIIEPVKRPYSSVRVGNFSYNQAGFAGNIDQFDVYVDGVLKGNVAVNTFTNYFDLPSGNRRFVLIRSGIADTIYNDNITVPSFAELSVVFDGVYEPQTDTLMSFAPYPIEDGVVYVLEAPLPGTANVLVTNFSPNTATQNQIPYSLAFNSANFDTTIFANPFVYNTTVGMQIIEGNYTAYLLFDKTVDPNATGRSYDTLKVFNNVIFTAGMKENLFIVGNPNSPDFIKDSQNPLAVRPK